VNATKNLMSSYPWSFCAVLLSIFLMSYAADLRKQHPTYPVLSPARTTFVINVSAHIMGWVYLRAFSAVFDCFRWQLASTKEGIETTTFVALGHGTSLFGIVKLIWISIRSGGYCDAHIPFCLQRFGSPYLASNNSA